MALGFTYPFKVRYYSAQSTSTTGTLASVVAARGKYFGGEVSCMSSDVLTTVVDVLLNGSGVAGSTGISITSSTVVNKGGGVAIPLPTTVTFVNPGDVLGTSYSSSLGGLTVTHAIAEF